MYEDLRRAPRRSSERGFTPVFTERVETEAFVPGQWDVRIVRRRGEQRDFVLQPIRLIVGPTFDWPLRCNQLPKEVEKRVRSFLAFIYFAMNRLMARRLAASQQ